MADTSLKQKNVDTGILERTIAVLQGVDSVYDTDLYKDIMDRIKQLAEQKYGQDEETDRAFRIVADHIRTAVFILGDEKGVTPSNVDQGYVLRRLIRRAIRFGLQIGIPEGSTPEIAQVVIEQYRHIYPELESNAETISRELALEEERFQRTIRQGLREFDKLVARMEKAANVIDGPSAFRLYDTLVSLEFTQELAEERGILLMWKVLMKVSAVIRRFPRPVQPRDSKADLPIILKRQPGCILLPICCMLH